MPETQKEKDLKVLNYKIDNLAEKIDNFIKYDISDIKRIKLEELRDGYVVKRDAIVAGPDY